MTGRPSVRFGLAWALAAFYLARVNGVPLWNWLEPDAIDAAAVGYLAAYQTARFLNGLVDRVFEWFDAA